MNQETASPQTQWKVAAFVSVDDGGGVAPVNDDVSPTSAVAAEQCHVIAVAMATIVVVEGWKIQWESLKITLSLLSELANSVCF